MEKVNDFPMELFLENDSAFLVNRMVVAAATLVSESSKNTMIYSNLLKTHLPGPSDRYDEHFSGENLMYPEECYENTITELSCKQYEARFKMKKSTSQALVNFLKDCQRTSCSLVPLEKKVHVFLHLLTTEASFSDVGALFGLHKSSVAYIFHEVASILTENKNNFISWPSTEEQVLTSLKVNSEFKFPNCVGFIDACSFKVGSKRNKKDESETVLLQAVCDEALKFTDIHVGQVGVVKKTKVFKESSLSHELRHFVDFQYHILGDSNYKLRKNLITPFKSEENGMVKNCEISFNEVHLKARAYIGQAFDVLNEKFIKLRHIDLSKPEAISSVVTAACVLHNFILIHEGRPKVKQEAFHSENSVTIDKNLVNSASEKRQFLCNYMNYLNER